MLLCIYMSGVDRGEKNSGPGKEPSCQFLFLREKFK